MGWEWDYSGVTKQGGHPNCPALVLIWVGKTCPKPAMLTSLAVKTTH